MKIKFILCLTVILLAPDNNVVAGRREKPPVPERKKEKIVYRTTPMPGDLFKLMQNPAFKLERSLILLTSQSASLCSRIQGMEAFHDFCHQMMNDCSTMLSSLDAYCEGVSTSTIDEHLKEDFIGRAQKSRSMIFAEQQKHTTILAQYINPYLSLPPRIPAISESKEEQ